ncbi:MAG: 2-oxoacid:acceptor oxidoreductase family protein [Candidatus Omnitrophota bacterium]
MTERVIIAGAGGQGIMLLGKILAEAAMHENKYVTWLPSYGAEVRGGTAHCMVVISDKEIGSPFVDLADSLIIMNAPSLEKFKKRIKKQGLLIINGSLAPRYSGAKLQIARHPFTDIAVRLGNIRVANMVALGCLLANKGLVSLESVFKVIQEIAPQDKKGLIGINQQAVKEGVSLK